MQFDETKLDENGLYLKFMTNDFVVYEKYIITSPNIYNGKAPCPTNIIEM